MNVFTLNISQNTLDTIPALKPHQRCAKAFLWTVAQFLLNSLKAVNPTLNVMMSCRSLMEQLHFFTIAGTEAASYYCFLCVKQNKLQYSLQNYFPLTGEQTCIEI